MVFIRRRGISTAQAQALIDAETAGDVAAAIAAAVRLRPLRWQSGLYYDVRQAFGGTSTSQILTANRQYSSPFLVPDGGAAVDRIGINVTTAGAAGKVARLMIHANNPANDLPGALLFDGGTVLVDAIAVVQNTIAWTLPAGLLHATVWSDGAPTVTAVHSSAISYGSAGAGAANMRMSPQLDRTFGAAPDPWGTPTGFIADAFLRVSLRAV